MKKGRKLFKKFPCNFFIAIILITCVIFNLFKEEIVTTRIVYIQDLKPRLNIGIIVVIEPNHLKNYAKATESLSCYSKIHGYNLTIVESQHFAKQCPHKDKFFRRHCIVALILPNHDYILFLDADIGVINPRRRIEEFIDPNVDVLFYDRFYNQEIMAGSFILKNSFYGLEFIQGFADYEYKLPNSFHGTDNGALHVYVASKILPDRLEEYSLCLEVYNKSKNIGDLFAYESCIRAVLGVLETFPHIKIFRKGTGWARDNWLTNSVWSPERDFMLHSWKQKNLKKYNASADLPIKITWINNRADWYDPFVGQFVSNLCVPGNTSWHYDTNLISSKVAIEENLAKFKTQVRKGHYNSLARIKTILKL